MKLLNRIPEAEQEPIAPLDSAKATVRTLLDVIMMHGVEEIVCSPGSRNTPLLIAVDAREKLKKTVVIDERTAAFTALGKSLVSRKPVALIATSGTALLNYGPAIAEAYYQGLPLIVITADRPLEWIDQDDSQTLRQNEAFRNFAKANYDIISGREDADFLWYVNRIANEGMIRATTRKPGPVHFNIRLGNPLGETLPAKYNCERIIEAETADRIPKERINELAQEACDKKILIVVGFMQPDEKLTRAMKAMERRPNVAIMAETISNIHVGEDSHIIDAALSHWDNDTKAFFTPDILITIGGALVSRMLKEWLRAYAPLEHWSIGYNDVAVDCFRHLSRKIEMNPATFLNSFAGAMRNAQSRLIIDTIDFTKKVDEVKESDIEIIKEAFSYGINLHRARREAIAENTSALGKAEWSDLRAYEAVFRHLPRNANVFLSNGTSVRYAQLFERKMPHAEYCNRGVSGIDGCTSTAIGGMTAYSGMTVLLTGDMSFAYDFGAILTRLADPRMRIIVFNNGGGGIFRFIGTTSGLPQREKYFCADPKMNIGDTTCAFGWEYHAVHNPELLEKVLPYFFRDSSYDENPAPLILEIVTPPEESACILKKFLKIENKN